MITTTFTLADFQSISTPNSSYPNRQACLDFRDSGYNSLLLFLTPDNLTRLRDALNSYILPTPEELTQ